MDMVFTIPPSQPTPLRAAIHDSCRVDETAAAARILAAAEIPADMQDRIAACARAML